jgi:hypothetical protein
MSVYVRGASGKFDREPEPRGSNAEMPARTSAGPTRFAALAFLTIGIMAAGPANLLGLRTAGHAAAREASGSPPPATPGQTSATGSRTVTRTGIPECDKYAAMVRACLPKMCEEERMLRDMELGFALEMIPKQVELKGRQEAAQTCARDIAKAIENDEYGCYGSKTAPKSIRLDKVLATDASVTFTFIGNGPAAGEEARVVIARSISERPVVSYPLSGWKGTFLLDTASASPVINGAPTAPLRLEPRTTYCFVVESSVGNRRDIYRKGIFRTLPNK